MRVHPLTQRCSRIVFGLLLAAAGLGGLPAAATLSPQIVCGTTVPPGLVGPAHWTLAGSPYCVTGDILVTQLVIDPGVQVLVDGHFRIDVITVIKAVGTQAQPIQIGRASCRERVFRSV